MVKLKETIVFKITSQRKEDFEEIVEALEAKYDVISAAQPILDRDTEKWHVFYNLIKKVKS